jgi:rRNA maturation endonuclease Nob1
MRKQERNYEIVEVQEDVRIPGTDMILEAGDRIRVYEAEALDKIMKKVSDGKELSDADEKILSAALDATSEEDKDEMDKIMKKVRGGKELTDKEQKMLGAYIDASKSGD